MTDHGWTTTKSRHTRAGAAEVWTVLSDVGRWSEWNAGVDAVDLDRGLAPGSSGTLTPAGQEPLPFTIVSCAEGADYTSATVIAATVTLVNTQEIEPTSTGAVIHARSVLVGEAAGYFGQSFGPQLAERLATTLEALCRRAEQEPAVP